MPVVALLTPLPGPATALDGLITAGRATGAAADLLALGAPLGKRATRRAMLLLLCAGTP